VESYDKRLRKRIDEILSHLPDDISDAKLDQIKPFVRHYFKHVPLADILNIKPRVACQRALTAWEFAQDFDREKPKLRVFYPNLKEHGWTSDRAIVQLLNPNRPFLVDSSMSALKRQGYQIFSSIHPILRTKRNDKGKLTKLDTQGETKKDRGEYTQESLIDYEISAPGDEKDAQALQEKLEEVMGYVSACVEDWPVMLQKADDTITTLKDLPASTDINELAEVIDFLGWLRDEHFVFLGYVEYDFKDKGKEFDEVKGSALGLLRCEDFRKKGQGLTALPQEVRHFLLQPELVEITKARRRSPVHRPVHMDYVAVKRYDEEGNVIGERRMLGLFTSTAYFASVHEIPILRRRVQQVLSWSGFAPNSHDYKALITILESLPRDELFQIRDEALFEMAMGILSLETRPRTKIFARTDLLERFISCLIYVPRTHFSTSLRTKVQDVLEEAYDGRVTAYYTQLTDSPLARMHLIVKTEPGNIPNVDMEKLNQKITQVASAWEDMLHQSLREEYGENHGDKMFRIYGRGFSDMYRQRYSVDDAMKDIRSIARAVQQDQIALDVFYVPETPKDEFRLKVYQPRQQVTLSEVLPVLENMGVEIIEENASFVEPLGQKEGVWIRDFYLRAPQPVQDDMKNIKPLFEETLKKVWDGDLENDGFNKLVLLGKLTWREVIVLRACAKYLKQMRFSYDQDAVENALHQHPHIARKLFELFDVRFNPERKSNAEKAQEKEVKALEEALSEISNVTQDRILRKYMEIIRATMRTNFYQLTDEDEHKSYVSFKLRPASISDMPLPRPHAEIFVYSRRVEGVHLRGGKVARGGLRWSDRHEDFRTEVLGLMKAQMVKNAVIVPVGSKGGFIVKQPPASSDRQERMDEGIYCYITYLSGLLDITDNIVDGDVVPPKQVVRHDEDDPYLVVAADKGTATFSDIANGVSESYNFWLGDAFASGGSAGYDHKKMGITAKGAWVSVQRHFREMGKDIQKEDFTVVGIGDMSGDVFGNGMLLSKHICLVGAFNHMHIFVDPSPDAAASFKERKRLFKLSRSTWEDYDSSLISKGGGIFSRDAKSIQITKQMKECFAIEDDSLTPDELISAMMRAPVDLLWNGGIGTYVKSTQESHDSVGDRANDTVRVNGRALRCKVIGEGGNLGLTQLGRIEFAMQGGRINTDAIDNSAGVDCSDHEVNIKIAFAKALEKKKLKKEERDRLLESMTDGVEYLVLRDNILQTQALTIAEHQGATNLEAQSRVMRVLEKAGLLDRSLEKLPSDEEIDARISAGTGLTRPELALLLSYSKIELYNDLLDSGVPDDPYFEHDLVRYFPKEMQEDYAKEIKSHPLRREIIATVITNSIINRIGSTFFYQVEEDTGVHPCDIARAYVVARDAFQLRKIWKEIEALDGKVEVKTQVQMYSELNQFIYRCTLWFLRHFSQPLKVGKLIENYADAVRDVVETMPDMLRGDSLNTYKQRLQNLMDEGVPEATAKPIALVNFMGAACDIVKVSLASKRSAEVVGKVYFELGATLKLGWLRTTADCLAGDGFWPRQAATAMITDFYEQQSRLAADVMKAGCKGDSCDASIASWQEENQKEIQRYHQFIDDLSGTKEVDHPQLVVALRRLEMLSAL